MEVRESNEELSMAQQAALNKKNKMARASGGAEELPSGAAPVEAKVEEEAPPAEVEVAAEGESTGDLLGEEAPAPAPAPAKEEEEEPIRIAGKTFKTQKEAFEYAERLEQEKLIAEAHAQGVREALASQAPPPAAEPEEDFDAKFFTNPKETLLEMQRRARDEAVALIRQETAREKAWNEFLSEYPDIRRQDAEVILSANAKTIGALPWEEGRKALASAVYREYDEIANLRRPKTELTQKKAAVSPSGGAARGVTPRTTEEKPLSFLEQVRKNRK